MNIKAIAESISLDWEEALEYYGGDISMLRERLSSFEKDASFDELKKAAEENDDERITKCAHRIRKASEKVALKELSRIAAEVEISKTAFPELEEEYNKVIKALKGN